MVLVYIVAALNNVRLSKLGFKIFIEINIYSCIICVNNSDEKERDQSKFCLKSRVSKEVTEVGS